MAALSPQDVDELLAVEELQLNADDIKQSEAAVASAAAASEPHNVADCAPCHAKKDGPFTIVRKEDGEVGSRDTVPVKEAWGFWCSADHKPIKVRGPKYLVDKKKIDSSPFVFALAYNDVSTMDEKYPPANFSNRQDSFVRHCPYPYPNPPANPSRPFFFVVNLMIPGPPSYSNVSFFLAPSHITGYNSERVKKLQSIVEDEKKTYADKPKGDLAEHEKRIVARLMSESSQMNYATPFERLLDLFLVAPDSWKQSRFKFIPRVEDGAWIVRKGVGTQPAILGNKLTQTYYANQELNYMEVCVDVASSKVGSSLFKLCKGYATTLVMDMCFLFEAQDSSELPEALLGGVRIGNADLRHARQAKNKE